MGTATASALEHLAHLIRDIDVAMLTTVDRTGRLHSRPMMTLRRPAEGALWFFTQGSSHMVDDVHGHHPVNLVYVDSAKGTFVSVSGRARVVRDRARKAQLWERRLAQWLPNGQEDDAVVLLRVEVQEAEFWSTGTAREFSASVELASRDAGPQYERLEFP